MMMNAMTSPYSAIASTSANPIHMYLPTRPSASGWRATASIILPKMYPMPTPAPVQLRAIERVRSEVRSDARWVLQAGAGELLTVVPADPASPFGAVSVSRLNAAGALIEQTLVDPAG